MNEIHNLIFDFDGTLADTSEGVKASVLYALDSLSIAHSSVDNSVVGPSPYFLYKEIFKLDDNIANQAVFFHRFYSENEAYKTASIYDGVRETLIAAHNKGIKLFVVSLKKESVINLILEKEDIKYLFDAIIGVSENEKVSKNDLLNQLKKNIDFSESVYIGDTIYDYNCCQQFNLRFCFAKYGFGSLDKECFYEINSFNDILNMINN